MSRTHELKTWHPPFEAILHGHKRYEIRKDDREFAVGDELVLREWEPARHGGFGQIVGMDGSARYTGREIRARVTYKTSGGEWGIPVGLCVLSIEVVSTDDGKCHCTYEVGSGGPVCTCGRGEP